MRTGSSLVGLRQVWRLLSMLSKRRRVQLILLFLLQLATAVFEVVSIGLLVPFLAVLNSSDRILDDARLQPILHYFALESQGKVMIACAILFFAAIVLTNGLRLLTLRAQVRLAAAIGSDLSTIAYAKTLNLPYSEHIASNSTSLISTISYDLGVVLGSLQQAFAFATSSIIFLFLISTMIALSPALTVGACIFIFVAYAIVTIIFRRRLANNSLEISNRSRASLKAMQEGLGGIRDVLLDNSQDFFVKMYTDADRPMRKFMADTAFISQSPRFILEVFGVIAIGTVALMLLWDGSNKFSDVVPFLGAAALAANRMLPAVQIGYQALVYFRGIETSMNRTLELLNRPESNFDQPAVRGAIRLERELVFENVSFGYSSEAPNDRPYVLRDLTFSISANSTVALVGPTGCGKSTIADLIAGLLIPQLGNILIDGRPLNDETMRGWQANIAHVPQAIFLTDGTIAENIAFGVRQDKISMPRVEKAAQMAKIDAFIQSRNGGYGALIGERGVRLSGGQRQRIGIARALYKNASLIIFDEATSALDSTTEREVVEAVRDLHGEATMIMIAHRLTTVKDADVIFEINDGRIIASGNFESLYASSASFRELAKGISRDHGVHSTVQSAK